METKWIDFYNAKTQEQFSYEDIETVYVLKNGGDYKFSEEDSRIELNIDRLDAEKVIGRSLLVPTIAESVKVGQKIYDKEGLFEGYRCK